MSGDHAGTRIWWHGPFSSLPVGGQWYSIYEEQFSNIFLKVSAHTPFVMGWLVSPTTKFTCWSPNPQDLRIWHCLETGTLQMELRWDHTRWRRLLIQYDCSSYKKERFEHRHTHTGRMPCEHQGRNEAMQLQAEGHLKVSASHREPQERPGTDVPDSSQEEPKSVSKPREPQERPGTDVPDSSQEPPRPYLIANILPPELWNTFLLLEKCSTLLQEPSTLKHSFYFILSTYVWLPWVFVAVCGLSSCGKWRLHCSFSAPASHCGGFSSCGAPFSGRGASVVASLGLSCPEAFGSFPVKVKMKLLSRVRLFVTHGL